MADLIRLVRLARSANDVQNPEHLQQLVSELLGELLVSEGPPPEPIEGLSEGLRSTIVHSAKGRPVCVAQTWLTGPWRCLLLESRSVPMGRPVFLLKNAEAVRAGGMLSPAAVRTVTPSPTLSAIRRIVWACRELEIAEQVGQGAVHAVFGEHRTFLAWRPMMADETFNAALRGDTDNYAKTVLDALQSAGVLPNDRGVVRISAAKALPPTWASAPRSLDESIADEIARRRGAGEALETIRAGLRLSVAHMGRLVPDYRAPRRHRDPAQAAQDAHEAALRAFGLIRQGTPYPEARKETHASAQALRPLLHQLLRPQVLQGEATVDSLAAQLQVTPKTIEGIFAGDKQVLDALRARRPGRTGRAKPAEVKAMREAADDVLRGRLSPSASARKHGVRLASLNVRLTRERKKAQAK